METLDLENKTFFIPTIMFKTVQNCWDTSVKTVVPPPKLNVGPYKTDKNSGNSLRIESLTKTTFATPKSLGFGHATPVLCEQVLEFLA